MSSVPVHAFRTDTHAAGVIAPEALADVLRRVPRVHARRFSDLASDPDSPGIGLRIDLARGLTVDAERLLGRVTEAGLRADLMVPLARTWDFGYAREGRLIPDPRALARLSAVLQQHDATFGLLADPCAIIGRVLNSPVVVWRDAVKGFVAAGIETRSLGCSFRGGLTELLDLLWVYRAAGLLANSDYLRDFRAFEYESREFLFESLDPQGGVLSRPLDGIAAVGYELERAQPAYRRLLQITTSASPRRRLRLTLDWLIHTDRSGWRVVSRNGETDGAATTESVLHLLEGAPESARIGLAIDPADIRSAADTSKSVTVAGNASIRLLPYPFDHFLSVSSDIDWSTHAHLADTVAHVCDDVGLPFASSVYLQSSDARWPCWDELERSDDGVVRQLAGTAALDTIHGVSYSFDTIYFFRSYPADPVPSLSTTWPAPLDLTPYDGILITTSEADDLRVVLQTTAGEITLRAEDRQRDAEHALTYSMFSCSSARGELGAVHGIRIESDAPVRFRSAHTFMDVGGTAARVAVAMRSAGAVAPVFTAHGGAEGTRTFGSCVSREWDRVYPDEARLALDRPQAPFYALAALRDAGVRFLNPAGPYFSIPSVEDIRQLLRTERARDGSSIYTFARFFSRRFDESGTSDLWSYGKHGATAQGLPATFEDILQQLNWSAPGSGCIVYTHLGHKVGNQLARDLGWNAELRSAWRRVADACFQTDIDDPSPFRVWFERPSSVLAYAALLRGIGGHLHVRDGDVHIRSWRDPVLGVTLPAPAMFGGSWLHGLTVYVPDPWTARVFIDDLPWEHVTINEGGREPASITLVDGEHRIALVADGAAAHGIVREELDELDAPVIVATSAGSDTLPVRPVSLRNVTHWSFEIDVVDPGADWAVAFVTDCGIWYEAGTDSTATWPVRRRSRRGWQRVTLALATASAPRAPMGRIIALRVTARPGCRVRDAAAIRPCATAPAGMRSAESIRRRPGAVVP